MHLCCAWLISRSCINDIAKGSSQPMKNIVRSQELRHKADEHPNDIVDGMDIDIETLTVVSWIFSVFLRSVDVIFCEDRIIKATKRMPRSINSMCREPVE